MENSDEITLDVDLLESSFFKIRPRLSEFASIFYHNLFITYPETKPLFAHIDMKEQEQKLVDSLLLVVLNLRKPGLLTHALKDLGARHVNYGAVVEHYPLVGNILLATFEECLGSNWTAKTKQAWTDAYNLISKIMIEGANYSPSDTITEDSPITSKYPEPSLVGQENDYSTNEIDTSTNLSPQTPKNGFSISLLGSLVAGSGLAIVLLLIFL